ncbi:hypothetical protein ACFQZX_19290 [Mucilaginibacter litoreus]|uniref:Uncharacterized protein n=1 Tax=Mucilaginibacter litoreus TaxID=1048221 RepID=A0ABW3AY28_9SPHI
MEKAAARKLLPSLFISIFMITMGINSLIKGIEQHQTWRIIAASAGMLLSAACIVMILVYTTKVKKVNR